MTTILYSKLPQPKMSASFMMDKETQFRSWTGHTHVDKKIGGALASASPKEEVVSTTYNLTHDAFMQGWRHGFEVGVFVGYNHYIVELK